MNEENKTVAEEMSDLLKWEMKEDEYINNGLIYCQLCNTPRQIKMSVHDVTFLSPCHCLCQKELIDKSNAEEKRRNNLYRIDTLRAIGIPDKSFRQFTFEKDDLKNPDKSKFCKDWANKYLKRKSEVSGLLFFGDVGVGKTFLAGCIANYLISNGVDVYMTTFPRLIEMYRNNITETLNIIKKSRVLVIDDLGAEHNTSYAKSNLFDIIDTRERTKLHTIITTNLTPLEIESEQDIDTKRIYDRVKGMCPNYILITGESRR